MINLPSVNNTPYNSNTELPVLEKALRNYFKTAMVDKTSVTKVFKIMKKDPYEYGKADCQIFCCIQMPGKKFTDPTFKGYLFDRERAISTMYEYVMCLRKTYFTGV